MWHGIATLRTAAFAAGAQATATHAASTLTTSAYSLTSSATTAHATHLTSATPRRACRNMARGMLQALLVRTCRSTTLGEARESSDRMDRDFPCPVRVQTLTQILFHVPSLLLVAYSFLLL